MPVAQFNSRKNYFDDAGNCIVGAVNSEQAIKLGGLNYEVEKREIYTSDGILVPNKFATIRTDTNQVLGVVGKNYNIVQNSEGFAFVDELVQEGAEYECAGTYNNGAGAWMCAKTESVKILDDDFDPYILFTNSFDGSGTIKAMFTPVRVFCSNCFVRAEKQSTYKISIRHNKDVKDRLMIAKDTLLANSNYVQEIKQFSEDMAVASFTKQDFMDMSEMLVGEDLEATPVMQERANIAKAELLAAYNQDDLQNFNNSAYKALMAVSDYETHRQPIRQTVSSDIYLKRVMAGMLMLNKAIQFVQERVGYRKSF